MSSPLAPLLTIRNLSVRYGARQVLKGVSLDVAPGTLHALVGPNGAGKTTLIRAVLGEVAFTGDVRLRFQGTGVIGYVPQLLNLDSSVPVTVADFFTLMLRTRPVFSRRTRDLDESIARALESCGAGHLASRPLAALSGGETRRVLMAQALVPKPELLLLDEPASSVDEEGSRLFESLLTRLVRDDGVTVLMVSHDSESVARTADRITFLDRRILDTTAFNTKAEDCKSSVLSL
jgi:zinc transport system ATP-binding protein